jgi:hypothetical protein
MGAAVKSATAVSAATTVSAAAATTVAATAAAGTRVCGSRRAEHDGCRECREPNEAPCAHHGNLLASRHFAVATRGSTAAII